MVNFMDRMTRELAALPGTGCQQQHFQPISAFYRLTPFDPEGRIAKPNSDELKAIESFVEPNYFKVMGLPIESGRPFGIEDRPGTRSVAVLSASAARAFWPGEQAAGKRFKRQGDDSPDAWITVVGVVRDIHEGLHKPPKPYVYYSSTQQMIGGFYYFLQSAAADPYTLLPSITHAAGAPIPGRSSIGRGRWTTSFATRRGT